MKLIVLCACITCLAFSFTFNSTKIEELESVQERKQCDSFCTNIGCNMIDYRYKCCSCSTPDGCVIQGDIVTLDEPTKHTYVTNVKLPTYR